MKRTIPIALLLTILLGVSILPAGCHQGFSHQPSTINQMKLLVTPQALQEALAIVDTAVSDTPSNVASINKMRLWVYSNIKQSSDDDLHGVNDYWQTPAETLALKAGDCEDFAILLVSMMRAYGAPKDQVYVAVGNDANGEWHAFIVERYTYGAWVEFDPEYLNDAVLLVGNTSFPYKISYCFNDQNGFNGTPVYPKGYIVPTVNIVPVPSAPHPISITDAHGKELTLDEVKQLIGALLLPTYLPPNYFYIIGAAGADDVIHDEYVLYLQYKGGAENQLIILESTVGELQSGLFQAVPVVEQIQINGYPALLGFITIPSYGTNVNYLGINFVQNDLEITIESTPADSLTREELIKIASSMTAY
jgi:predicted transglutaminase-like cysteine proteinase